MRSITCVYDLTADRRKKLANHRNIQELAQKAWDIQRHCGLLGGILATIRAGSGTDISDLIHTIQKSESLADLAFYVDSVMTTWPAVYQEFQQTDFDLGDSPRRPSVEDSGTKVYKVALRGAEALDGYCNLDQGYPRLTVEQLQDAAKSGRRGAPIDGDTGGRHEIQRHQSLSNRSEGRPSIQANRLCRPWELS